MSGTTTNNSTNGNAQDIESPRPPTESSPLLPHSGDSSVNSSAATTPTTTTSHSHVEDPDGDFAKELEKPWPATFERSMMILAGPIMDEKSVDAYTKSPSVRNRYLKKNQKQGFFTPDASTLPTTPGTPAWLKKGLVRLKSLDYRFSDDDTAIFPGRMPQTQRFEAGMRQTQKKKDSHAYRMEVLKKTGGLRSAGNLEVEVGGFQYSQMQMQQQQQQMTRKEEEQEDVTKSPGFRREKQIDRQRREEKRREEESGGGARKERGAEGEGKGKDAHGHGVGGDDHKSSFMQSTFNMANILMGVGMLGLPYVLKSAGWIGGTITTIGFCLVTWRTSYYLGRELNGDPRPVSLFDNHTPSKTQTPDSKTSNGSHSAANPDTHILQRMRKPITSFPGIAREAFGDNGCICLSAVLYFELFSCLSIFFVSLGDHLHALFPSISQSKHMTIAAGVLIVPSAVLRTPKLLSYLSAVGTIATVAVVSAVVLSALVMFLLVAKAEHDFVGGDVEVVGGNERDFTLYSSKGLPLALGIVAYCFSGHAIVPSIYSSMARPQDFERMINVTYGMVLACCLLVGISGYYMFGNDVEDQITLSLENQSENGNTLMTMLTWLMILTAMSKFTLTMFPLALGFEEMLTGILPSDLAMELIDSLVKIILIVLSLAVAIFFPSFSFLCSLVGLICTMIVSVIFPAMAHLKLFGSELSMLDKIIDWLLVVGGSTVAVVGTIATVQADA